MKPLSPKQIIEAAEIPSILKVLQQILSLADNPKTSGEQLEASVTQEPALVAQLLKWVNSASYSLPQRVSSIAHAMILLGFSTVKSIASGMVLINTFDAIPGLDKKYIYQVWGHTLTSAAIIKFLTRRESSHLRDDTYLAAMIHDVGYLVLKQYFGTQYNEILLKEEFPAPETEQKLLNVTHTEIAWHLLMEWKFPENVAMMVRHHHDVADYTGDLKALAYVRLADFLAHQDFKKFFLMKAEDLPREFILELESTGWDWFRLNKIGDEIIEAIGAVKILFFK